MCNPFQTFHIYRTRTKLWIIVTILTGHILIHCVLQIRIILILQLLKSKNLNVVRDIVHIATYENVTYHVFMTKHVLAYFVMEIELEQ